MNLSESYKKRLSELAGINEDFGEEPIQRFERAIYLTYIEGHQNFKRVSKEEFHSKLQNMLTNTTTLTFDRKNIYRLADKKEIWWNNLKKLGEIWIEDARTDLGDPKEGYKESYWINLDVVPQV